MAVILDETLSGAPPEQVAEVPQDIVYRVFGRELSMGKSMGLMSMVGMVANMAKKHAESGDGSRWGRSARGSPHPPQQTISPWTSTLRQKVLDDHAPPA